MSELDRDRRRNIWLFGTLLICFLYFLPQPGNWNEDARLDTTLALVNHGTFAIDRYRWNAGFDTVLVHGHYYQNKAPGQSLLAVPVVELYNLVLRAIGQGGQLGAMGDAHTWNRLYYQYYIAQCLVAMYTVAIPSALFFLFFFWFLGFFTSATAVRLVATLATAVATNFLPYAGRLYPHALTGALLFSAFALLYALGRLTRGGDPRSAQIDQHPNLFSCLAGCALGGSFMLDHTSAIPSGMIALYGFTQLSWRQGIVFIIGAVPALIFVVAYDHAIYGGFLRTGYNPSTSTGLGVGGTAASATPSGNGLRGLTLSPYRGLFFMSPFLLAALPGLFLWRRRGELDWLVCASIPTVYIAFVSTIYFWDGGFAVGPRYLVPIIPFVALPVVFVLDEIRHNRILLTGCVCLIAVSALNVWAQTAGGGSPSGTHHLNPLFDWSIPHIASGDVALSWGSILLAPLSGIHSKWTLMPFPIIMLMWSAYKLQGVRPRFGKEAVLREST